ncbi:MAG: FG-GAP repeat protein, partial [Acidimicrobiia bacterium]|nr:FG-GAP repeat protein [Acidimicrobiia bacterium]
MTIAHQGSRAGSSVDRRGPQAQATLGNSKLFARLGGLVVCAVSLVGHARSQCAVHELHVLDSGTGLASDQFGERLAMSERFLFVVNSTAQTSSGTPGSITVLERTSSDVDAWLATDALTLDGVEPAMLRNCSIAVDGDVLVVGVRDESSAALGAGAAFVFERSTDGSGLWPQTAKLTASDAESGDSLGSAVDVCGNLLVVGAPGAKRAGFDLGAAYVFARSDAVGAEWKQVQKLMPAELGIGSGFGWSVATEGDRLVVGAWSYSSTAPGGGAAFCYGLRDGLWVKDQVLAPDGLAVADDFGVGIALAGDDLVIGASGDDTTAKNAGACYTYTWSGDSWSPREKLVPLGASEETYTGAFLALDSNRLFVGSPIEYKNGSFAGAVIEFRRESEAAPWVQTAFIEPSDSAPWDTFGVVAAADGILAVGAGKALSDPG